MDVATFSIRDMFAHSDDSDDEGPKKERVGQVQHVIRKWEFPGKDLWIREFEFHALNANLVWPGAQVFAAWLSERPELLKNRRILELGSGTGALAIFLKITLGCDITTSDYDDKEIESNIAFNCEANEVQKIPHIRHSWGETFPFHQPNFDLIIASDILLYVKQYGNLIKSLKQLLTTYIPDESKHSNLDGEKLGIVHLTSRQLKKSVEPSDEPMERDQVPQALPIPAFLMSWRRRIPREDEVIFFDGCRDNGLQVIDLGSRVYCIHP